MLELVKLKSNLFYRINGGGGGDDDDDDQL